MKTSVIAVVASLLLSISNIFTGTASNLYKNTIVDENNREVTTVYSGEDGKYLTPVKQYTTTRDDAGNITERKICVWNGVSQSWTNSKKYIFKCNTNGDVVVLGYIKWNTNFKQWEKDITYTVYQQNIEEEKLVINNIKGEEAQKLHAELNK